MTKKLQSYNHTIYASYIGYITLAIVNNFAPLLFLTFAADYDLSIGQITWITTVNFLVQLSVDLLCSRYVDKLGYRKSIVLAHLFAGTGLIGIALLPELFGNAYAGILTGVALYAVGGGAIEVMISPIVEACPTEKKEAAMSLLHSFYCWGHVLVVVVSTAFFSIFGIHNWKIMACIWAAVPLMNILYFSAVPMYSVVGTHEKLSVGKLLGQKIFWLLIVLMLCAGASEQAMGQWASAFAESALKISKTVGDLAGPCAFALCMGLSRALYSRFSNKIPLTKMMILSACLCIACYLTAALVQIPVFGLIGCALCGFSVGIFWPGTFSIAALALPGGGTAMYALMALAGDFGCGAGPTAVGMLAERAGGNLTAGLSIALIFPIVMLIGVAIVRKNHKC